MKTGRLFQRLKYPGITFTIAFLVLFTFYHEVLLHPNDFIFASSGDGIKNYYTFMFHARYDPSFWEFGGMNFPFQEHIVYMDAHPLLSWLIGKVGLASYGIGILNLMMLLSYPLGAVFIYLILRHFNVKVWWAIAGGISIAFMSPQVFRLTGHLSLSYVFAIPLMWWLLLKFLEKKSILWSLGTGLYLFSFFFIHPYLGMIMALFVLVFWLVRCIVLRKEIGHSLLSMVIQVALPILLFQLCVYLTDTHMGRLSSPAGFYDLHARWSSLLVPHHGPLNYISNAIGWSDPVWEAWSYVGFTSVVFFAVILFYGWKHRKTIEVKQLLRTPLSLFIISAYIILLFSFCFPMKFDFMHWMTEVIGALKQFRVLGRFAWVFFYVATVALIIILNKIALRSEREKGYNLLFFGGILFFILEFSPVHYQMSHFVSIQSNTFKSENLSDDITEVINELKSDHYGAVIFLPFDHMSSENVMLLGTENSGRDAMLISYHTGLPLLNSISSRMSLDEAVLFNNFFGPEFAEKELDKLLPSNIKIAVVRNREYMKADELRLEWSSDPILENEHFSLLEYNRSKWNSPEYFNKVKQKNDHASFELTSGWRSDTSEVWFYYEDFDDNSIARLDGEGAFQDVKKGWNFLLTLDPSVIEPGSYTVSFWYYLKIDRPDGMAVVEEVFPGEADPVWVNQFDIKQSTHIVTDWCMVKMDFTIDEGFEKVNFLLTGNESKYPFYIDELLIQKQGDPSLFKTSEINGESYIVYNNYRLKANSFSK